MSASNIAGLKALVPQGEQRQIHLFTEAVAGKETMDIPDPYYIEGFEETYHLVEAGTLERSKRVEAQLKD